MADNLDIVPQILRDIQREIGDIKQSHRNMHDDMRAGFASMRGHLEAQHRDINMIENRLDRMEDDVRLLKRTAEFPAQDT